MCTGFISCSGKQTAQQQEYHINTLIDLYSLEEGDELPVNPNTPFDYKLDENCYLKNVIVKARLVKKPAPNEYNQYENYFEFEIEVTLSGEIVGDKSSLEMIRFAGFLYSPSSSGFTADLESIDKNIAIYKGIITTKDSHLGSINFYGFAK